MKRKSITKKIVVFYHGPCADGFSGAWVARKKFGAKAQYIPVTHYDRPYENLKNKKIFFIDVVYSARVVKKLLKSNEVTIIDHHKSAKDVVSLAPQNLYAVNNCGSVLAWRYFFPKKKMPMLLRYIENMDLWKWSLPRAKQLIAFLDLHDLDFNLWSKLARDFENPSKRKKYADIGAWILKYEDQLIKRILRDNVEYASFQGKKILVANSPVFDSKLGHILAKRKPPFGAVWRRRGGRWKFSLRSIGNFDVSKLAAKYPGGGGHKNASGFSVPEGKKLPLKFYKK